MSTTRGRSKYVIVWTRTGFKTHLAIGGRGRTCCGVRYMPGGTVVSPKDLFITGTCATARERFCTRRGEPREDATASVL